MTEEEISSIRIGDPFGWTIPDKIIKHTEETAISYRVLGLRESLRASVHSAAPGRWYFAAHGVGAEHKSAESFSTKESALDGLKDWLRTSH